jgi:hypothetical protein
MQQITTHRNTNLVHGINSDDKEGIKFSIHVAIHDYRGNMKLGRVTS